MHMYTHTRASSRAPPRAQFTDRGTPRSYRCMDGFSSNTYTCAAAVCHVTCLAGGRAGWGGAGELDAAWRCTMA